MVKGEHKVRFGSIPLKNSVLSLRVIVSGAGSEWFFGFERWFAGLIRPFVLLGRHEMPYWWFRDEPLRHSS
jgi:hypothetical protein